MRNMASYKNNKSVCPLFHFPNVVGFEELHEVVVFLLTLHLFDLLSNGSLIGRSLYVADYTESHWESMLVVHHGELQLQGVVLTVSVVNEDVLLCDAILADLHYLQTEALLHKTELVVLTEDQRLAVLHVDGVLLSALALVDRVVNTVVEDNAVLQNLAYRSTLMLLCSLQHLYSSCSVGGYGTCKETTSCTEAKLCRTEWVLYSTEWRRLADKTAWTGRRILSLCESIDTVVQKYHIQVDVTTHGVDEVVTTDSKTVAVTADLPDGEVRIGYLGTGSDGSSTSVDGLHRIGINIVWQTA